VLSVIALHLALVAPYEGISFDTLRMITETSEPGEFYWRLKSNGAFSSKSLPLYMRLLTTDLSDVPEELRGPWARMRVLYTFSTLVSLAEGDKSAFVPVGIKYLSDPSEDTRVAACGMLRNIAKPDDIPKLKALVEPDRLGTFDTLIWTVAVIGAIGGEDEVKYLETVLASKHVQNNELAREHVTAAIKELKGRLEAKAKPPDKK
jgi:hypothetical protein